VMPSVIYKQSQVAVKYLRQLMGGKVFENPKDHEVIARLIRYITGPGDIILDSFAGSGTTGHSVLQQNADDSGKRRFILVELDANIAKNITAERLRRVVQGYTFRDRKGNEKAVAGVGSGYRYCELGATLFDPTGQIRPEVKYAELAQHVFFVETGSPLPRTSRKKYPLLGVHDGVAIYLLYNGVLKDKSPHGGNVLTRDLLASLPVHDGLKVVYGTGCRISEIRLRELGVVFRQIPYEVKAS
jgi:adenine-specific DNA-methyltransferase